MTDKDKLKAEALKKLDQLVIEYLKYYEDTNINLEPITISKEFFTEEEYNEIKNSITQVETSLEEYCKSRGIDSPLLKKYHNGKEIVNK